MRSQGVLWIAQESAGVVPGTSRDLGSPADFVLSRNGKALALTAPHGGRIDWL